MGFWGNLAREGTEGYLGYREGQRAKEEQERQRRIEDEGREQQMRLDAIRMALMQSQAGAADALAQERLQPEPAPTLSMMGRQFPDTPEGQTAALQWRGQVGGADQPNADTQAYLERLADLRERGFEGTDLMTGARDEVRYRQMVAPGYGEEDLGDLQSRLVAAGRALGSLDPNDVTIARDAGRDLEAEALAQFGFTPETFRAGWDQINGVSTVPEVGGVGDLGPFQPASFAEHTGIDMTAGDARPPVEERMRQLKQSGVGPDEAKAILLREGYTFGE